MSTVQEVFDGVTQLKETLLVVDTKLDGVKLFIENLKADTLITQDQLNTLNDLVNSAKDKAVSVLAETEALTSPVAEAEATPTETPDIAA